MAVKETKEIKLVSTPKKVVAPRAGDTVRVWQKITERIVEKDKVKEKKRLQAFEGLVLGAKHGKEAGATFTVRKVVDGIGVERIFPIFSPLIDKIEVLRTAKVRQAKLYHIRRKAAKEIRREMSVLRKAKEEIAEQVTDDSKEEADNAGTEEKKEEETRNQKPETGN